GKWGLLLIALCSPRVIHAHSGSPCEHPGKTPIASEWNKLATERWSSAGNRLEHLTRGARQLTDGAKIGRVLPPGVAALDADTHEAAAWLSTALPDAPVQMTARGAHFLVRVPEVVSARVGVELAPGVKVDVRVAGKSQIVCEPSTHSTGAAYVWKRS